MESKKPNTGAQSISKSVLSVVQDVQRLLTCTTCTLLFYIPGLLVTVLLNGV